WSLLLVLAGDGSRACHYGARLFVRTWIHSFYWITGFLNQTILPARLRGSSTLTRRLRAGRMSLKSFRTQRALPESRTGLLPEILVWIPGPFLVPPEIIRTVITSFGIGVQ